MVTAKVTLGELTEEYLKEAKRIEGERRSRKKFRNVEAFPFWPHEAIRDTALILFFTASILYISAGMPYFLEAPANPAGQPEVILPDWYLLWSYGLLKPGVANPIGEDAPYAVPIANEIHQLVNGPDTALVLDAKTLGIVLNILITVPLVVLPFVDRGHPRRPQEAPLQAALGVAGIVFIFLVSVFSVNNVVYNEYPIYGATMYDLSPRFVNGVTLADSPALDGMQQLSVTVSFRPEEINNPKWILSKADSLDPGGVSYYIRQLSSNAIEYGVGVQTEKGPKTVALAAGDVSDAQYHHVAMVYNASTLVAYLDGEEIDKLDVQGTVVDTDAPLRLGYGPTAPEQVPAYYAGRMDNVRVLPRALSEEEVATAASGPAALGSEVVRLTFEGSDSPAPSLGIPGALFSEPATVQGASGQEAQFTGNRSLLFGLPAIAFWLLPLPIAFFALRWKLIGQRLRDALLVEGVIFLVLLLVLMYNIGDWTAFLPFHVFQGCEQPVYLFFFCIGNSPLVAANPGFDPIGGLLAAMQDLDNTLLAWLNWWLTLLAFEVTFVALVYWKQWGDRRQTYEFFLNRTYYRVR